MKIFRHLTLLIIFFSNPCYGNSEIKDFYGFVGGGLGFAKLSTDVVADNGDKDGLVKNFTLFGTYYHQHWMASLGIGYYDLALETKKNNPNFTKLITETFYLDLRPEFRINHRFSVGLSYQQIIGEEFLAAPTNQLNANNETTTKSLAGLTVNYDIPFKQFRIRTGFSIHKPLSVGNRDIFIPMLTVQLGAPLYDAEVEPMVIYKYRDREVVKMAPAAVIELGEQIINFKTGSAKLNKPSKEFLRKVGEKLDDNLDSWQIVRIVGHTDIVGDKKSNQRLSELRAESVKNIFIEIGLERERVFFLGLGEAKPKIAGLRAEDHRINRRVELQFIGRFDQDFAIEFQDFIKEISPVKAKTPKK